jgi:hypothetical protein
MGVGDMDFWRFTRLLIEVATALAGFGTFQHCQSLAEAWRVLQGTNEAERIGLIVAVVIVVSGVVELVRMGWRGE